MAAVVVGAALLGAAAVGLTLWLRQRGLRRAEYIRTFALPRGLYQRLAQRHPGLSRKDCELIAHGLRQFFLAYLRSGRQFVAMPSQIVDDLWHEFILFTRHYQLFCRQAFGGFLHHTPAVVLSSAQQSNAGLRRCWWHVCREERINPRAPSRLPLLFALDAKLNVRNGFRYQADCQGIRRADAQGQSGAVYCGGDFSSSGFDGGTEGLGDSPSASSGGAEVESSAGCGGGCSGGCGGD